MNEFISTLIGKMELSAKAEITKHDMVFRIMWRDGVSFVGTADCRADRINLEIQDGIVIHASIG